MDSLNIPPGLVGLINSVGAHAILAWYLWFSQTKSIPDTRKAHAETLSGALAAFTVALKDVRDQCAAMQAQARDDFARMSQVQWDLIERLLPETKERTPRDGV